MYKDCYKQIAKCEMRCLWFKLCENKSIIQQEMFDKEVPTTTVTDAQYLIQYV